MEKKKVYLGILIDLIHLCEFHLYMLIQALLGIHSNEHNISLKHSNTHVVHAKASPPTPCIRTCWLSYKCLSHKK